MGDNSAKRAEPEVTTQKLLTVNSQALMRMFTWRWMREHKCEVN